MTIKVFLTTCLIIVSISVVTAQNTKTLEYDLSTGNFNGIMPFDQPFNLKLTNIGDTVDNIKVAIIEIPKKDYNAILADKKAKNSSKKIRSITPEDIYNWKPDLTFEFDTLLRHADFSGNSHSLPVPFYLKPESKYLLDIKAQKKRSLREGEKDTVAMLVVSQREYQDIINDLIKENISDPFASPSSWATASKELNNQGRNMILRINKHYSLPQIDYDQQLATLSGYLINLNNISSTINSLNQIVASNNRNTGDTLQQTKRKTSSLINTLTSLNWFNIRIDDANYSRLIQQLNSTIAFDSTFVSSTDHSQLTAVRGQVQNMLNNAIHDLTRFNTSIARDIIANSTVSLSLITATNPESLREQAKLHVTFDLGYAYVWNIDRGNAYGGINIYFRSIDTSLPLKNYKMNGWDFIGSRTSLLIGASVGSIKKDNVRKGLISDDVALITGIGFRLLPWFKINSGFYHYYLYKQNPILSQDRYSFASSPFVSVSIDFNLSSFFQSFGNGSITTIFRQQ